MQTWLVVLTVGFLTMATSTEAQAPPRFRAVAELRIGDADAENYSLTRVADVAVGADGAIYVAQAQEKLVRVFDRAGRFVRAFGREGAGPGEFREPERLGWRGDTLWVADSRAARISLFEPPGRFLSSVTFRWQAGGQRGFTAYVPFHLLADGSVLGGRLRAPEPFSPDNPQPLPELRFSRAGRVADTVAVLPTGHTSLVVRRGGRPPVIGPQPFRDDPLIAAAPDGSALVIVRRPAALLANDAAFTVTRLTPRGDTVYSHNFRYRPRPISRRMADSVVASVVRGMDRFGGEDLRRAVRDALYIPAHLPPIEDVIVGRDGTVWLRRESSGRTTLWNVLGRDGTLTAIVEVPSAARLFQAQLNRAWGVEHDEADVPYVVRYRLVRAR